MKIIDERHSVLITWGPRPNMHQSAHLTYLGHMRWHGDMPHREKFEQLVIQTVEEHYSRQISEIYLSPEMNNQQVRVYIGVRPNDEPIPTR